MAPSTNNSMEDYYKAQKQYYEAKTAEEHKNARADRAFTILGGVAFVICALGVIAALVFLILYVTGALS